MSNESQLMQAPRGMRDFYPDDMALRRHLEGTWRQVATRHGFEEVEGPTFEHLALYTKKSGEGIISEIFRIEHRGDAELALRPEFTPTLARLIAAKANSLPQPIKWFATPLHFRAERPQRGRLREHQQWNVDFVGWPDGANRERQSLALADAEVIGCMLGFFREMGLTPAMVRLRLSHRPVVAAVLLAIGVAESNLPAAFALLDRRDKLPAEEFDRQAGDLGLDAAALDRFKSFSQLKLPATTDWPELAAALGVEEGELSELKALRQALEAAGLLDWCDFDFGIVRGLAYYTGVVFEAHEASGGERAIAGGGRYDNLVELFGGPSLPAVGFGMGDVVLRLVLEDRGLLPEAADLLPHPDVFVISSGKEDADAQMLRLTAALRAAGRHTRRTYKATRNVGKLLKEASSSRATQALIAEGAGKVTLKELASGEQESLTETEALGRLTA